MFDSILIPLDGSPLAECVLPHAVALMETFHPKVTLLHVMDNGIKGMPAVTTNALDWQLRQMEAEHYLKALGERLKEYQDAAQVDRQDKAERIDSDTTIDTHIVEGVAAESILNWAHDNGNDLIVLGSHGRGGASPWHISSVAQKVMLRADTSLLIARVDHDSVNGYCAPDKQDQLRYERVLIPMDCSQRAECVLPIAAQLASRTGLQIVLAHIVARPDMPGRTPPSQELIDMTEQFVERNRIEAEQYLQEIKQRLPGNAEIRVRVSDDVRASLHDLIASESIDLVLTSAHGYSGQSRWPQGSVVTNLVEYGATSILIVQDMAYSVPGNARIAQQTLANPTTTVGPATTGGRRDTVLVGGR